MLRYFFAVLLSTFLVSGATFARADSEVCQDWLSLPLPVVSQTTSYTCGVACLDSALRYLLGYSPGERTLAYWLGSSAMHGTFGAAIVHHARLNGLFAREQDFVTVPDLTRFLTAGEAVILAWNSNGSPHYSLLRGIGPNHITMMDPWHAMRNPNQYNQRWLAEFLPTWYDGVHFFGRVIRISRRPL